MIQDTLKLDKIYSTVPGAQERVSEQASERAGELSSAEQVNEWPDVKRILNHCARVKRVDLKIIPGKVRSGQVRSGQEKK